MIINAPSSFLEEGVHLPSSWLNILPEVVLLNTCLARVKNVEISVWNNKVIEKIIYKCIYRM